MNNNYYDSFDCEIQCEEVYGGYDTECFEIDEEEFEDWHDTCDRDEDAFLDSFWEAQCEPDWFEPMEW